MSHKNYKCIVCHLSVATVAELHRHQSFFHNSEELSLSIINLQNLVKSEDCAVINEDSHSSNKENVENYILPTKIISKDVNHNSQVEFLPNCEEQIEPLCLKKEDAPQNKESFIFQELKQEEEVLNDAGEEFAFQPQNQNENAPKIMFSSIKPAENQDYFQFWESELNKPFDGMFSDEFSVSITSLCEELKNPKCRAPKRVKRKIKPLSKKKKQRKKKRSKKDRERKIKVEIKIEETEICDSVMTNSEGQSFQLKEEPISHSLESLTENVFEVNNPVFHLGSPNLDQYLDFNEDILKIFEQI